ncbi:nitric oxide reductase activation protein NorD [Roseospirillum parvum]|uniref:von Willebrand factor type A domain-containing protein n=1 Tax=Roseospirillum parvum TaxID=83401 RepID=A0A1G7URM4_9PROT|nr:VWA domain-containing protein [Roseospirillum parvum]SDG50164.1 von Willebrand factor type A domain-containing protein [Roseospirillum parvum]
MDQLFERHPELVEVWSAVSAEAVRVMSPAAYQAYGEGALALSGLGRGADPVRAYLEEMPEVVREVGEDVLGDCTGAALKLSSMTSGAVIALLLASLPTAARRLGDPDLVRGYLALLHQLSARAPRGLRPMLQNIDHLLGKLTLSGLRRWADFGIEAYRRDHDNLMRYFALQSADSQAMLQQERRGTLFVDAQRRLNFYLRALWGRDFFLRPSAAEHSGFWPYIDGRVVHLPDALDDRDGVSGFDLYKAMAAHMAAHLAYTRAAVPGGDLAPAEKLLVGLFEDARVEYKARAEFPGLGKLWGRLLALPRGEAPAHPTLPLLEGLARALAEPGHPTGDAELDRLAAEARATLPAAQDDAKWSLEMGRRLFVWLTEQRRMPSLRLLETLDLAYRDDNRVVFEFTPPLADESDGYVPARLRQRRRTVSVMEMVNEIDCELAGDDAQEIWRLETPFWLDQEATTINELEGTEPVVGPFHYAEWDHQVQLYRPDWVSVYERRQPKGPPADIDALLDAHRPLTRRIQHIIDALQPQGVERHRGLEDGDEIDLTAAVDAMIELRRGHQPDPRITLRHVVRRRDLAVVVLLDLSQSTNDALPETTAEGAETVLDLTRQAAALLTTAIAGIGDPFAVHGFASDSRHDVQYVRFKDFAHGFDEPVKARLAGMRGGLSTRMGAALRHAGAQLARRPERRKLILLLTDGAPADVDERDPRHLREDARKAVEDLHGQGVQTYCLTLDSEADPYVKRIFGDGRYTVIDRMARLPETLPGLFASLTR